MLFNFFEKFVFIKHLPGSHNISFIIKNRFTKSIWVAKFSKKLTPFGVNFRDLNERALLAYRLSQLLNGCIPETKIIKLNKILYSFDFIDFLSTVSDEIIKDNILITKFSGIPLNEFLKVNTLNDIENENQLLSNFVFNLWIGNYDKKNGDYVIDQNNRAWSVDYNLLGPGFSDLSLSLGGYARGYNFDNVAESGWCLGEVLIKYLREKTPVDIFNEEITKIENLSETKIKKTFDGLTFYREGTNEVINDAFINYLIERRRTLKEKVDLWVKNGFPRT